MQGIYTHGIYRIYMQGIYTHGIYRIYMYGIYTHGIYRIYMHGIYIDDIYIYICEPPWSSGYGIGLARQRLRVRSCLGPQ